MKPVLRTIRVKNQAALVADRCNTVNTEGVAGKGGYALPPDMENRPNAAELRAFIRNFHKIDKPADRQAVMDAVFQAAAGEN